MKKIKNISIIILIITLCSILAPIASIATENKITIYGTKRFNNLLKRNGVDLTCIPLVYKKDNVEHPVYCLNLELDGPTETFSYDVNIDNELTNMEIWRTVVNGYPYKTPEELGCKTKEEAYLATRQAVYCAVYGRDPESYGALGGEAGERTLNALKQIVKNAREGTETKQTATLKINAKNTKWEIDQTDKKYVSKEFSVSASAGIKNYSITLEGTLVEGTKLTDVNNIEKNQFSSDESFKILIPIKNIETDGNFHIKAEGAVATKPVLLGISGNSKLQNVAVTGSIYEQGKGLQKEYYFKNETKIIIIKQDQESKKTLQGVKFQLLNEEREIIYSELTTDKEGKIIIENLLPGKYYVREFETLEGYEEYDKMIEIDLKLNEETKITVNNLLNKTEPVIEKINTEIEVEQTKTENEIKQAGVNKINIKLPKTGM